MCEFSEKLIAWLDQELRADEAGHLERHLANCPECWKGLAAYREVSGQLAAYCDALVAGTSKRRRGWVAVACAAVAAAIVLVLLSPSTTKDRIPPLPLPPAVQAPAIAWQTTPVRIQTVPRQHTRERRPAEKASWQPGATDIQIVIPAEAIFPPGAVPEGFQFIADLSIAADGSPQGIRILP